jgi:hypothetical protein
MADCLYYLRSNNNMKKMVLLLLMVLFTWTTVQAQFNHRKSFPELDAWGYVKTGGDALVDSSIVKDSGISGDDLSAVLRYKGTTILGGTSSSTSTFDTKGRFMAVGDSAVFWREIFVTPTSVRINPASSKPDYGTWLFSGQSYLFDAASPESLYFDVEIPHDHKTGTPLNVHVHWAPTTTNTGACAWKIAWMVKDINSVFAFTASDTLSVRQAGSGTAYTHQIAGLGSIDMTGISKVSALMSGVLIRDANKNSDSFTGEAVFLDIGFHYQADKLGSWWEYNH